MIRRANGCWRVALVVAVAALSGCGTGAYEALMEKKQQELLFGSIFLENLHPGNTPIVENAVALRLPLVVDFEAKALSTTTRDNRGDAYGKDRLQPPFLELPGYRFCYEKFVPAGNREELPFYCYFAVVDANQQSEAALLASLKAGVAKQFRGAVWQKVELDTPAGGKIAWQKMSVKGPQLFSAPSVDEESKTVPGQFDLYVHSTPEYHVLVGFRSPDQIIADTNLFKQAEISLGTLEVQGAAAG